MVQESIGFIREEKVVDNSIYAGLIGEVVSVILPGNSTSVGRLIKTTEMATELCPVLIREDYVTRNGHESSFRIERDKPSIITTGAIIGMNAMSKNYLDSFEKNLRRNGDILYL